MFNRHYNKATYYRFLGSEKNRFSPNGLPAAERTFFDSSKLIHAEQYGKMLQYGFIPKVLFARFFEERQSFHFDIGLRELDTPKDNRRQYMNRFSRTFLETPFLIISNHYEKEKKEYSILDLESALRDIYLYATSSKKSNFKKKYSSKIIFGYPALFIVYDKQEQYYFGDAKSFHVGRHIKVRHDLVSLKNTFADVWYIGKDAVSKHNPDLRNLRIYLSKLHSWKESARIILNYSDQHGNNSLNYDKFTEFLKYMQLQLSRERYYSYENKDFEEVAFYLDQYYNDVTWKEFKKRIKVKLEEIEMNKPNIYNTASINNGPVITVKNSQNVNIEISKTQDVSLDKLIQEFKDLNEKFVNQNSELTNEEKDMLSSQSDTFLEYTNDSTSQKKIAKKMLENFGKSLKSIATFALSNSEKIEKLMTVGGKIIEFLN